MFALLDTSKDPKAALADAADAWRAPIGAASPLWFMFAGVASAGVAYWWMSRWRAEATNLEAALTLPALAPEPVIEAAAEVVETVETAVEAPVEAAIETLAEVAPEPVVEAAPEPVVEAAPEPVGEAAAEPAIEPPATKPRAAPKAKAAPKADLA